jgi:hypothetical protein
MHKKNNFILIFKQMIQDMGFQALTPVVISYEIYLLVVQ